MKTFAYVPKLPGKIQEIVSADELFEMHPDIAQHWFEVPAGSKIGDVFDGAKVTPGAGDVPAGPDQRQAILASLMEIDSRKARAITDAILSGDKARLQELEAQAQTLRAQLAALN